MTGLTGSDFEQSSRKQTLVHDVAASPGNLNAISHRIGLAHSSHDGATDAEDELFCGNHSRYCQSDEGNCQCVQRFKPDRNQTEQQADERRVTDVNNPASPNFQLLLIPSEHSPKKQ